MLSKRKVREEFKKYLEEHGYISDLIDIIMEDKDNSIIDDVLKRGKDSELFHAFLDSVILTMMEKKGFDYDEVISHFCDKHIIRLSNILYHLFEDIVWQFIENERR